MSDYITPEDARKLLDEIEHERTLIAEFAQEVEAFMHMLKSYHKLPKNLKPLPVLDLSHLSHLKPLPKNLKLLPVIDISEEPSPGDLMPADWRQHYLAQLDEITNGHWKGVLMNVPDMAAIRKAWSGIQGDWADRTRRGLGTTNAGSYRGIRTHAQRDGLFWSYFAAVANAHIETEARMSTDAEAVKMQAAYWAMLLDEMPAKLAAYNEDPIERQQLEGEVI